MLTLVVGNFLALLLILHSPRAWAQSPEATLLSDRLYILAGDQIIETDELRELYQLSQWKWFWVKEGKATDQALQLRQILKAADQHGLDPQNYWTPLLERVFQQVNLSRQRTFEILASDALIRYAQDLSRGQILDPDLIDEDIKMLRKNQKLIPSIAEILKGSSDLRQDLEKLAPQNPLYQSLKETLAHLRELQTQSAWGTFRGPDVDLRPGQSHNSLPEIKKRLQTLGYGNLNTTTVYDNDLEKSVKRFQALNGFPGSRNLTRAMVKSLSVGLQERMDQIKANMEKLRWFPGEWEPRHLFVNLAFQEASLVEADLPVLQMRTVNGRPTRRTPTLKDEIRFVEPQPTWTVPFSIAVKDKLEMLRADSQSLARQKIWVYDQSRNLLDPTSVDWQVVDRTNFHFTLVQQPGPHNALGLVKFPLTNPWFIYMHDTNEPHLFKDSQRLRSSGCVRLEKPWDLAEFLLRDQPEWTKAKLLTPQMSTKQVFVRQNLPVYFLYLTAQKTASGEIRFAQDQYGQDQRLLELFKTRGSNEKF